MALTYFAFDGNYGDAQHMWVIETDQFTGDEWEQVDNSRDALRIATALSIIADKGYGGLCGPVIPVDLDELEQAKETLNAVIYHVTATGFPGWGAELGDILNILERFTPAE